MRTNILIHERPLALFLLPSLAVDLIFALNGTRAGLGVERDEGGKGGVRDGTAEAGEVAGDEVDDLGGGELVPEAVGGEDDEAEGGFAGTGRRVAGCGGEREFAVGDDGEGGYVGWGFEC